MFVVCQYKKKIRRWPNGFVRNGNERERGGGGGVVELDHGRRVRKRTGSKVHIESNPRNTSVLGSECVLVDANRQDEVKSAHLCLRFNVDPPASSFSSLSLVTPYPPPPSHSHSWRSRLANDELCIVFSDIYSSSFPFRQLRPVRILRMCARSGFSPNLCPFNPCVERFLLSACACDGTGSSNNNCNSVTGACTCINNLLTGRTCDECPVRRRRATIPPPPP